MFTFNQQKNETKRVDIMIYLVDMWFKMVIGLLGILYMPGIEIMYICKFIKYRIRGKTSQRNP